jgi:hypothetical protein
MSGGGNDTKPEVSPEATRETFAVGMAENLVRSLSRSMTDPDQKATHMRAYASSFLRQVAILEGADAARALAVEAVGAPVAPVRTTPTLVKS